MSADSPGNRHKLKKLGRRDPLGSFWGFHGEKIKICERWSNSWLDHQKSHYWMSSGSACSVTSQWWIVGQGQQHRRVMSPLDLPGFEEFLTLPTPIFLFYGGGELWGKSYLLWKYATIPGAYASRAKPGNPASITYGERVKQIGSTTLEGEDKWISGLL